MDESSALSALDLLIGYTALVALTVVGLGTMVGLVKPPDSLKHCGVIIGLTITLVLAVSVFVGLWSSISLWHRVVMAAVALVMWQVRREQQSPRRRKERE